MSRDPQRDSSQMDFPMPDAPNGGMGGSGMGGPKAPPRLFALDGQGMHFADLHRMLLKWHLGRPSIGPDGERITMAWVGVQIIDVGGGYEIYRRTDLNAETDVEELYRDLEDHMVRETRAMGEILHKSFAVNCAFRHTTTGTTGEDRWAGQLTLPHENPTYGRPTHLGSYANRAKSDTFLATGLTYTHELSRLNLESIQANINSMLAAMNRKDAQLDKLLGHLDRMQDKHFQVIGIAEGLLDRRAARDALDRREKMKTDAIQAIYNRAGSVLEAALPFLLVRGTRWVEEKFGNPHRPPTGPEAEAYSLFRILITRVQKRIENEGAKTDEEQAAALQFVLAEMGLEDDEKQRMINMAQLVMSEQQMLDAHKKGMKGMMGGAAPAQLPPTDSNTNEEKK